MVKIFADPSTQQFLITLAAVLLPYAFMVLKKFATKTKTMADDEFLTAIENILEAKLNTKVKVNTDVGNNNNPTT